MRAVSWVWVLPPWLPRINETPRTGSYALIPNGTGMPYSAVFRPISGLNGTGVRYCII